MFGENRIEFLQMRVAVEILQTVEIQTFIDMMKTRADQIRTADQIVIFQSTPRRIVTTALLIGLAMPGAHVKRRILAVGKRGRICRKRAYCSITAAVIYERIGFPAVFRIEHLAGVIGIKINVIRINKARLILARGGDDFFKRIGGQKIIVVELDQIFSFALLTGKTFERTHARCRDGLRSRDDFYSGIARNGCGNRGFCSVRDQHPLPLLIGLPGQ